MRKLIQAALATAIVAAAVPAAAQYQPLDDARRNVEQQRYEYDQALRNGDRRAIRAERQDLRRAERDYARLERQYARNGGYYGNRGYDPRYGQGYDPRYPGTYGAGTVREGGYVLGANDQIYRGQDGRYYCRRSDGTTGTIVGALGGGVLGNVIAPGGNKTLGSIIGGTLGAVVGRSVDRGEVRCQ